MRRRRRLGAVALALWIGAGAGRAGAQVLEIGAGGAVRVFDTPATFTGRDPSARAVAPIRVEPPTADPRPTGPVDEAALAAALSPELVAAVAWRESRGRHGLVSPKGALGEMQLMPATARALRVDARDTRQNYRGGAVFLAALMRRYDGDLQRALAAYNAGPGAVDRHGGVPPYRETQAYVAAVLDRLGRAAALP